MNFDDGYVHEGKHSKTVDMVISVLDGSCYSVACCKSVCMAWLDLSYRSRSFYRLRFLLAQGDHCI